MILTSLEVDQDSASVHTCFELTDFLTVHVENITIRDLRPCSLYPRGLSLRCKVPEPTNRDRTVGEVAVRSEV
jgi:hypothetical protein